MFDFPNVMFGETFSIAEVPGSLSEPGFDHGVYLIQLFGFQNEY